MLRYFAGNMFCIAVADLQIPMFKKADNRRNASPEKRNLINDTGGISPSENEGIQPGY